MNLEEIAKVQLGKKLSDCSNEEIYVILLNEVQKLAKSKERPAKTGNEICRNGDYLFLSTGCRRNLFP